MDDKLLNPGVSPVTRARNSTDIQDLGEQDSRGAEDFFKAYEQIITHASRRWNWQNLRAAWALYNAGTLFENTPTQYAAAELARKVLKRYL
jgi:hypothetical protein